MNLDILERKALSLDLQDLYHKIVLRQRGGYCFELNALFGCLLRELGYTVTDLVARFWRDGADLPPMRRNHVLKVEAEGINYLCDVGVGGIAFTLSQRNHNCRKTIYLQVSGVNMPQIPFSTNTRLLQYALRRDGIHSLTASSALSPPRSPYLFFISKNSQAARS